MAEMEEQLESMSRSLKSAEGPHLFWLLNSQSNEVSYWANLDENDGVEVIHWILKHFGNEILDRVMNEIIADEPDVIPTVQ